jgi:hypothetical protein
VPYTWLDDAVERTGEPASVRHARPAGLAMLAFAIGFAAELDDGPH